MAPRPNWKGYLKLSLVSCPVALYPATTTSERVSFRTLNRATGNRVRRQFVDEETGEPVAAEDQAKGYEIAKGEYITLEDDELAAIRLQETELSEHRLAPPEEALRILSGPLRRRVGAALEAGPGECVYLEDGLPV